MEEGGREMEVKINAHESSGKNGGYGFLNHKTNPET